MFSKSTIKFLTVGKIAVIILKQQGLIKQYCSQKMQMDWQTVHAPAGAVLSVSSLFTQTLMYET